MIVNHLLKIFSFNTLIFVSRKVHRVEIDFVPHLKTLKLSADIFYWWPLFWLSVSMVFESTLKFWNHSVIYYIDKWLYLYKYMYYVKNRQGTRQNYFWQYGYTLLQNLRFFMNGIWRNRLYVYFFCLKLKGKHKFKGF